VNESQYYSVAPIGFAAGKFHYLADTTEGQSGSPLLVAMPDRNGNPRSTAVGIHVQGGNRHSGNSAVAIGESVANFISGQLSRFESRSI
jgi:V8-like Glu-specific endopeptidase